MNAQIQELVDRCAAITSAGGEAISWIGAVRGHAPRVDREADGLILKLRQARNLARRLGQAARRPVAVGFFGLSQAGKSYLISALAADEAGALDTLLDGERLSFIAHVNPPGGGKEATGLVTRFTRCPLATPSGYPVRLSLFSEIDLVKILGNSFFNDFDHEQREDADTPESLRTHLARLEARRQREPVQGVTADDLVDLGDYFQRRFPKTTAHLAADYWPTATTLAPHLDLAARAELYSVLWGRIDALTRTFTLLAESLADTGYADHVFAPLSALVTRNEQGGWSQTGNIMNVDILGQLGRGKGDALQVMVEDSNGTRRPVSIPRATLAALTAELRFELAAESRSALLERVDLLDFPGYRGRLRLVDLDDLPSDPRAAGASPVSQLILRGKVAYLFERYTESQEMNALVVCAPANKQIDVEDLGPVLDTWVRATQGAEPETRQRRPPGLIWAITMFDYRLAPNPQHTEDLVRQGWEGMMKAALLERFGKYNWVSEWSPGGPFRNLVLVRKPGLAPAVIETRGTEECRIQPTQQTWLAMLKQTFCACPTIARHLDDPAAAWDAVLTLNDGGMQRLASVLSAVTPLDIKLERIGEQIADTVVALADHRLARYHYAAGDQEVADRQRVADAIATALNPLNHRFADLLRALQPRREHLHALYLRSEEPHAPAPAVTALASDPWAGGLEPQAADSVGRDEPTLMDGAGRFARAVFSDWAGQLRRLPENEALLAYLGVDRGVIEDLTDALVVGVDRLRLEHRLVECIQTAESQTGAKRSLLAERQAFIAALFLGEYVDLLGLAELPPAQRPHSTSEPRRRLFAPQAPIPPNERPRLPPRMTPYPRLFKDDWLQALRHLCTENAGHRDHHDLRPQDNARLGEILVQLRGAAPATRADMGGHS